MRKLLFLLAFWLFANNLVSAQDVSLPLGQFRDTLMSRYPSCFINTDVNGDLMLNLACAATAAGESYQVQGFGTCCLYPAPSLEGLQYFTSILYLDISNNNFYGPEVTLPPNLLTLDCSHTFDGNLPVFPNSLTKLICRDNYLFSGSQLTLPPSIRYVDISENYFQSSPTFPATLDTLLMKNEVPGALTIGGTSFPVLPPGLRYFDCSGSRFGGPVSLPTNLRYLNCSSQYDGAVPTGFPPLNLPPNLEYLNCSGNAINSIVSLPATLTYLDCSRCRIFCNAIEPGFCPGLDTVYSPGLSSLPALPPGLTYLNISVNAFTEIPSPLPATLQYLYASYNVATQDFVSPGVGIQCLPHLPASLIAVDVNYTLVNCKPNTGSYTISPALPLCTVTNNTHQCETNPVISGRIFYDNNSNGIQDPGENYRSDVRVNAGPSYGYSNSQGYFEVNGSVGTNTLAVEAPPFYQAVPATSVYTFNSSDTIVNDRYALQPVIAADSVAVNIIPTTVTRPGHLQQYRINYEDVGTTNISAAMQLRYDASRLTYNSSSVPGVTSAGNTLTIPAIALTPGANGSFYVNFFVDVAAVVGDTVKAQLTATYNSQSSSDSTYTIVRASLDPNDKTSTPTLTPAQVTNGTYIDYLVRFQNTGTDTTFTVVITDELDAQLQASSVQMIAASHPANIKRTGNLLTFEFIDIQLPDSNVNEPASHGYIRFRVKPLATLATGSIIPNDANIYFDYNSPVLTNTATTGIGVSPELVSLALCSNGNTTIQSNITGSSYQWQWNTGTGFTNISDGPNLSGTQSQALVLSNIPANWNQYLFRCIVDGNVNSATFGLSVAVMTATASSTPTSCPGISNGSISIDVSTGTAPYTYSIDGGSSQTGNQFTGLTSGTHNIIFTDVNGCSGTIAVNLGEGAGINGSLFTTGTSCPGINNGTIIAVANSGTAPYTYSLDGAAAQLSNTFTAVAAGNHNVVITDVNGCTVTLSVVLSQGSSLNASVTTTDASCGASVGSITVTALTGVGPYSYILDGGIPQASNTFTAVAAGVHHVMFTDANGCTGQLNNIVVNFIPALTATSDVAPASCGLNNAVITINALGGSAPYTYTLNGGIAQLSAVFTDIAPGTYNIGIQDAAGCEVNFTATVASSAAVTAVVTSTASDCGSGSGTINVNVSTGTSPFLYALNGGAFQSSNLFSGLAPGNYSINVTDATGCTFTGNATVSQTPGTVVAAVSMSATATDICFGTPVTFTASSTNGGSAPIYQWRVNAIDVTGTGSTYASSTLMNGDLVDVYLVSNLACLVQDTVYANPIQVLVNNPQPSILIAGNTNVSGNEVSTLTSSVTDGGNNPAYQWQDSTATHGWLDISGAQAANLDYTAVADLDKVRCVLTSDVSCASGTLVNSNVLTFNVGHSTSGGRLYPNPSNGKFTIDNLLPGDNWENLTIAAADGRKTIATINIASTTSVHVNVSYLQSGLYLVTLHSREGKRKIFKLIKH